MVDEPFAILEKKIVELATTVKTLKAEKEELLAAIEGKKAEVAELSKKLSDREQEREDVRGKVDRLLSRLDSIDV